MKLQTNLFLPAVLAFLLVGAFEVGEKSLVIERYPGEPLQLVDLKVSGQSVKQHITAKNRYENKWGTDIVKFTENDDWYKRVSLTFRSVADKPIRKVEAYLLFEHAGDKKRFGMELTSSRNLFQSPLQPGEEVELTLADRDLELIGQMMKSSGVDANNCSVSFSLDSAIYSEKLRWYRGALLHPDPEVPNKWIPVKAGAQ